MSDERCLVRIRDGMVEHRSRRSSPRRALNGVDLTIDPGDHVALLGPNGSGKSTLLRVLAGVQPLTRGTVERRRQLRLGVVFQSPALDPLLTVRENLKLQAALSDLADSAASIERLCAEHGLEDRLSSRVKTLSGGLARRVEFVRAILTEPDVLLLDEPTVGLDLPSRAALLGAVESLRAQRPELAVIMSTHLMTDAERCARVVMMAEGGIVREGSPASLIGELGELLLGLPPGASVEGVGIPFESLADGSQVARPADEAELTRWSAMLAEARAPFFVREPTLADAYLRIAGSPLQTEAAV